MIAAPPTPPVIPPAALKRCRAPAELPDRDLSAAETTGLWARDRAALRDCETRRAAAAAAIKENSE